MYLIYFTRECELLSRGSEWSVDRTVEDLDPKNQKVGLGARRPEDPGVKVHFLNVLLSTVTRLKVISGV